jgi:GTPase SAR1 family protein
LLEDFPTAPRIHAASLRRGCRRILLVGPKGVGKTTLTLRLIQEGYDIEGDENVFVTPGGVVARPRGLKVKQSTIKVLPHLTETLAAAAYYQVGSSQPIYNLDPRQAGASSWRIEHGRVNVVMLLRPNHGDCSSLRPLSPLDLVRSVIKESAFPKTQRAEALSAIVQVISNAKGFELALGDLNDASACIEKAYQQLT